MSIAYLVGNTLVYPTFFCDTEAMRLHATAFTLHALRQTAAARADIKQIFIGTYKEGGRTGTAQFYLDRGCRLVRRPAHLVVNPVAKLVLSWCLPKQHRRLVGVLAGDPPELPCGRMAMQSTRP